MGGMKGEQRSKTGLKCAQLFMKRREGGNEGLETKGREGRDSRNGVKLT